MQRDYLRGFVPIEGEAIIDMNENGIPDRLEELLAPELHGGPIIGGYGLSVDNQFNEFMSVSNSSDNPANGSNDVHPVLSAGLPTALEDAGVTNITPEQILTRIDTQTCGGCHETSAGQSIGFGEDGGDIDWPMEVNFVHARKAQLSDALIDHFLPARMGHLQAARALVTHPSDLNLDGTINVSDLLMLISAWGSTEGGIGDVNGDCHINVLDLLALIGEIGWTDPTDAVETRGPAVPGPQGRDDDELREEAPRPEVARDDGTDTSEAGTAIDRAEREVAQARNQRERDEAIRELREIRVEAGEREAAQEGALVRVRPTH